MDAELTVDIDDRDMDRVEGWISEFPKDMRKQMELFFRSDAVSETVSESIQKLTAGMQCVNSQLQHSGGVVLGSTVLSKQKFSDECIESIGEEPPGFFAFLGTGQDFGIRQRYHLEKCRLSEFADKNEGRQDFIRNVFLKAELFKTAGYAAFCHTGDDLISSNLGSLMFVESTEYEHAWSDLLSGKAECTSLESCWEHNLDRLNRLVAQFSTCEFVEGKDFIAERDALKVKVESGRTPELFSFGIAESYYLIRLISSKQRHWNDKLLNTMKRDCAFYDAAPADPKVITGHDSNARMLFTAQKDGKEPVIAEYLKKKALGEFCVDASVQQFFDEHYTTLGFERTSTGNCGEGYTTVTDCSGDVERGASTKMNGCR